MSSVSGTEARGETGGEAGVPLLGVCTASPQSMSGTEARGETGGEAGVPLLDACAAPPLLVSGAEARGKKSSGAGEPCAPSSHETRGETCGGDGEPLPHTWRAAGGAVSESRRRMRRAARGAAAQLRRCRMACHHREARPSSWAVVMYGCVVISFACEARQPAASLAPCPSSSSPRNPSCLTRHRRRPHASPSPSSLRLVISPFYSPRPLVPRLSSSPSAHLALSAPRLAFINASSCILSRLAIHLDSTTCAPRHLCRLYASPFPPHQHITTTWLCRSATLGAPWESP
jgi:hypothetical protein